jgi:hypothetical protein
MNVKTPYNDLRRKVVFDTFDRFPNLATNTMARVLVKEHPEFFDSAERARDIVRYYRGLSGTSNRHKLKNKKYAKEITTEKQSL